MLRIERDRSHHGPARTGSTKQVRKLLVNGARSDREYRDAELLEDRRLIERLESLETLRAFVGPGCIGNDENEA